MTHHLALSAILVALAVPAPVAALEFGIGEQAPAAFADPRLRALELSHARLIVPWDAATTQPGPVREWLDAVSAAGMRPHVAFNHRTADRCPNSPCVIPTRQAFAEAVSRFRALAPEVSTYTVWNEANHNVQPVRNSPETVARFYDDLRVACPRCTIVAGDVLDSGTYFVRWLERFAEASTTSPRLWGLHNYGDASDGGTANTDAVLDALPGELWIEETGGIITLRNASGRTTLMTSEEDQAQAVRHSFAIARDRPRIGRMYLYQWRAEADDRFDSGLLRPDGTSRPSLTAAWQALMAARPQTTTGADGTVTGTTATPEAEGAGPASPGSSAAASTRRVAWRVGWTGRGRDVRLVLRGRCAQACTGKVRVTLRTRERSGRARTYVLRTRTYRATSARRTATLRLSVPSAILRAARRARSRKIVLATGITSTAVTIGRPRS